MSVPTEPTASPKRENLWVNIILNVLLPSLLLTKGKKWGAAAGLDLDSKVVFVVALSFPIMYGIYDYVTRRKTNFFSILGFVSVLITGGIGLMELDKDWIAWKEAAIPALFGLAVLISLKTPFPLVRTFLYNPEIFDVPKIEKALREHNGVERFEKVMKTCTLLLVASFMLSAVLNYVLARYLIQSETGTDAFIEEMGKMTLWSWPVITLPTLAVTMVALTKLIKGIHTLTGLNLEDVMHGARPAPAKVPKPDTANS